MSLLPPQISQCGFAQIWVEMHQRVDTFLQNLFEDNMQVAGHHPLLSPPGWGKDGLSEELLGAFDTQLENDDDSVSLSCCLRPSPLPIVLVLPRADRAPLRPGALPSIP